MINRTADQVGFLVSGAHVEVVDCTVEDCPRYTQDELDAAVAAERERCAKLCETLRPCQRGDCDDLTKAIRGA